jgi:hypothetical protein
MFVGLGTVLFSAAAMPARAASFDRRTPMSAQVGDMLSVAAQDPSATGNLWYRFRVRYLGMTGSGASPGDFSTVIDFSPVATLDWTAEREGRYEIETSTRNNDTGEVTATTSMAQFTPRVTESTPVITETANSMVARYSAPPCPAGSSMRVVFSDSFGNSQSTPARPCDGTATMNFYVAGMRPATPYSIQHVVDGSAESTSGPSLSWTPPATDNTFGPYNVVQPPSDPNTAPVVLQSTGGWPVATDLAGNLVWYYPEAISFMARPAGGGRFLGWYENQTLGPEYQIIREFDVVGTTIRETNAARVSEQLMAMGMHPVNSFHHEVREMPDGKILALASTERILTDVQGPGAVDVLGDMIVVLDRNLQVVWAWDTFDHLDPHRMATLNETCNQTTNGCANIYLAPRANDWTHGNALQLLPDGNLLYSARHQDWVIKIDYENGQGTGNILWRLGKDGDFQFLSNDIYPWFSHQHDPNMDANGLLTVFDNGNLRYAADPESHSRGQAIQLDEQNMTATLVLNADLGDYSVALGSAQKLSNGNYYFHMGDIITSSTSRVLEIDPAGDIVYRMDIGQLEYRSFRINDLYTQ